MSNADLKLWNIGRFVAYYAAAAYLKKGTKITDILPLPNDEKRRSLKDLTGDELKQWYEKRKQAEIKAGLRKE